MIRDIAAESIEDLRVIDLALIKSWRMEKVWKTIPPLDFALELLMVHVPHTPKMKDFIVRFMKDQLAVVFQNEVALVLNLLCCT
jgi:hypothetical protein